MVSVHFRLKAVLTIALMSFLASCNYIDDPHGSYQLDPADLLSDNSLILSQIITDRIDRPNNPDRGKGYDDFGIELRIEKDESSNWYLDLSDNARFNAYKSYSKSKLSAVDTYIESTSGHGIIPPWLFDCGISEDVRIYSDVTLFGRPAGKIFQTNSLLYERQYTIVYYVLGRISALYESSPLTPNMG